MVTEFYIGTYDNNKENGIFKLNLDTNTGEMSELEQISKILNPSYMVMDKEKKIFYSILSKGESCGAAATELKNESQVPFSEILSDKNSACHINIDKNNLYLFTANYKNGEVKSYKLGENGEIEGVISEINHNDMNLGKVHPHYVSLTPDEKYLFVIDLGLDMLVLYEFLDGKIGKIVQTLEFKKGSGPRHLVFHNNNENAYVITEYSVEVAALKYSVSDGFEIFGYVSALTEEYAAEGDGGAIRITKDGTKLFSSSRKPGAISMFHIDEVSKIPVLVSIVSSGGVHTRDINLDDSEKILIAANRFSNNLVSFFIDKENNTLKRTGFEYSIPEPTTIIF